MAGIASQGLEDSPLFPEEWQRIREVVVSTARRTLVGRRFIDLYGPLGAGVQTVPFDEYRGVSPGAVDTAGDEETQPVYTEARRYRTIPIVYKDFRLHWRDIEAAHEHKLPLDFSLAAGAAAFCSQKEDALVFYGDARFGLEGLLNAQGRLTQGLGDWSTPGNGFADVVAATERLQQAGHFGPYAMVLSPRLYAALHRIFEKTGVLEIATIRELITDGIFQSNQIRGETAAVISTGRENLDLAVAMDMTVAYLGPERMNYPFRVLEMIVPRIKHPDALCTLERA